MGHANKKYTLKYLAVVMKQVLNRSLNVVVCFFRVPLQTVTILKFSFSFFFLKPNKKISDVSCSALQKLFNLFQNFDTPLNFLSLSVSLVYGTVFLFVCLLTFCVCVSVLSIYVPVFIFVCVYLSCSISVFASYGLSFCLFCVCVYELVFVGLCPSACA
jgi:hypothetical protein